jgi:hypothetical protein
VDRRSCHFHETHVDETPLKVSVPSVHKTFTKRSSRPVGLRPPCLPENSNGRLILISKKSYPAPSCHAFSRFKIAATPGRIAPPIKGRFELGPRRRRKDLPMLGKREGQHKPSYTCHDARRDDCADPDRRC